MQLKFLSFLVHYLLSNIFIIKLFIYSAARIYGFLVVVVVLYSFTSYKNFNVEKII